MPEIDEISNIEELSKIEPDELPSLNWRDTENKFRQDLKYKYLPFRLYYKIRSYKYAKYRNPELNIIKDLVSKNQISIDVGANLGLFTYFMARHSKHVYAFEPNPYPLRNLKNVVDKNVTILPIALGSSNGKANLKIPRNIKGWSSNGASLGDKDYGDGMLFEVQCRKLDSLKIENIGLIKIDVEGFETDVLKGAENIIKKQKPTMIIENETIYKKGSTNVLFEAMREYGYEKYICKQNKLEKFRNFSFEEHQKDPANKDLNYIQNFIFIKK